MKNHIYLDDHEPDEVAASYSWFEIISMFVVFTGFTLSTIGVLVPILYVLSLLVK